MFVHGGKKRMMCPCPAIQVPMPAASRDSQPQDAGTAAPVNAEGLAGPENDEPAALRCCLAVLPATAPYITYMHTYIYTCITTSRRAAAWMSSSRRGSVVVVAVAVAVVIAAAAAAGITTERVGNAACVHIYIYVCMLYMKVIRVGMLAGWEHTGCRSGAPPWAGEMA